MKYFKEDVLGLELLTVNKRIPVWIYEAWLAGECYISYTTLLSIKWRCFPYMMSCLPKHFQVYV